jgi:hypothetical protein
MTERQDMNKQADEKAGESKNSAAQRPAKRVLYQPDPLHPGPNREERERSKGDLHHDQHEKEKEMEFKDL